MCQTIGCCRGGHTFACWDCQTTAKGAYDARWYGMQDDPKKTNKRRHPRCPKCRKAMEDMGLRWSPPKRGKWKRPQAS